MTVSDTSSSAKASVSSIDGAGSALSTVAGPAVAPDRAPSSKKSAHADVPTPSSLLQKMLGSSALAAAMPNNPNKPSEFGEAAYQPVAGVPHASPSDAATASTLTETTASEKVGKGIAPIGLGPAQAPLDRVRTDDSGQALTTNQGVAIADNQNSLKVGLRGPTALEDFILREKITHFDHERIPERVVHARGSAAHGYFESYGDLSKMTRAIPFSEPGKRTPVFVRFSTVAGERGSADTVRDVRGFAVKFYTEEGNWDLVGNNIPVFFIQDAMKFPDLVHAVKPEPHFAMPQASSAHDTFWDFVSLMPESTHMLLWQMSDRAIPRSYRMMQGFGVHTFRLVNAEGESVFCKFHWTPVAGTHSLIWDEAVKISGADPDFHRRDLWEAIEAGAFPEWELGLQVFTEAQAEAFEFDVLDATKLVPEETVPVVSVGKLVLNRNPDNFFAETEQVAFCTAHIIPGIDFTNDPLLQGRIHSYLDTQISRLGGANFHEIPINSPITPVHNNQRDGMHRQAINRGRVAYEPNSLGGGCPFQAGMKGFHSYPERVSGDKVRGKAERFAEHYGQARLFWQSQTAIEQQHIINAFQFELTRVQTPAIRQRVVSLLLNVDVRLASEVAQGLGMDLPDPAPLLSELPIPSFPPSPGLSLLSRAGDGKLNGRRVAILVAAGLSNANNLRQCYEQLIKAGAVPRFVGKQLGRVAVQEGNPIEVEISLAAGPAVLYDGVILPEGEADLDGFMSSPDVIAFVTDQFAHGKPLLVSPAAKNLLQKLGVMQPLSADKADAAIVFQDKDSSKGLSAFMTALAGHRQPERQ